MPKAAEASLLSGQGSCSSGPMKTSITAAVGVSSNWIRRRPEAAVCLLTLASVLQTMQMMVGLFNVGLGSGRTSTRLGDVGSLGAAYWLGAVVRRRSRWGRASKVKGCPVVPRKGLCL